MDELINAMSDEDLVNLGAKYADIPSVLTLVNGILATRAKEQEQVKAKADFAKGIAKAFDKLPHPEDIYNVYARWGEVEEEVEDAQAEEVEIRQDDGSIVKELRKPMVKVSKWLVEVNKGTTPSISKAGNATTAKRTITVYKHNASGADDNLGVFANYAEFAKSKGIMVGADSARRAVERDGYYGVFVS